MDRIRLVTFKPYRPGKQVGPYLEYIGFGLYLLPFLYQLCQMSDFCWKVLR